MQRRDPALVDRIWIGASPNKPGNDLRLGAWIPRRHARSTVNGIVKWFGTASIPGANVGALGNQLLYNAGLKCRCRHVQSGIALVNVVTNPVEEVSLRILPWCGGTCPLFRQLRRSIKQSNGGQVVTDDDCLHEVREGVVVDVAGIQLLSPLARANHIEAESACISGSAAMSLVDAVDGSSTGTSVPWMWALLKLPRFGGASHADDSDNRFRYRQVSLSGSRS